MAQRMKILVATVLVGVAVVSSFVAIRVRMTHSSKISDGQASANSSERDGLTLADSQRPESSSTPTEMTNTTGPAISTALARPNPLNAQSETNQFELAGTASASAGQTDNLPQASNFPTNSIELVWISPGSFMMGSPESEVGRRSNEGPQTRVMISRGYWLGKYEVTVGQYAAMNGQGMQNSPSTIFRVDDSNVPVTGISWDDATDFCRRLTEREHQAGQLPEGYVYRLPTDSEWEYACRAGTTNRFSFGEDPDYSLLDRFAWFRANSGNSPQPVGTKLPNGFGLYDMHGNAHEWVLDLLKFADEDMTNPVGSLSGRFRASRGGYWGSPPEACRSAFRHSGLDSRRIHGYGFRVALAPPVPTQ